MKHFWQRVLAALTPGVRVLLGLLAAVYLAATVGTFLHAFDLQDWLAVSGPKFWSGQIWRLVTYALLPAGFPGFLMNGIALVLMGGLLERHWSRGEFWRYCLMTAAGAGLAKVLLQFSNPLPLVGATPMMFGLLIGWGFLRGHESISMLPFGEMTVWKLVLVVGAVSFLIMFSTAGLVTAIIMAAGSLTGWLYLWLKHKWLMSRPASAVPSERISRLEL